MSHSKTSRWRSNSGPSMVKRRSQFFQGGPKLSRNQSKGAALSLKVFVVLSTHGQEDSPFWPVRPITQAWLHLCRVEGSICPWVTKVGMLMEVSSPPFKLREKILKILKPTTITPGIWFQSHSKASSSCGFSLQHHKSPSHGCTSGELRELRY